MRRLLRALTFIVLVAAFVGGIAYFQMPSGGTAPTPEKQAEENLTWGNLERSFLLETLKKNHWNRTVTARQLGIHTSTLWRKLKRLNIDIPKPGHRSPGS